jgi:hexosaminidase
MALYKMNRLHLHLTDDQGWRIEIKSKPKLTEIGSKGAVLNGRSGYLTQQDYIDLQTYAEARNIIIIPEIDMPGHIYSALVAYPELNCDGFSNIEPRMATPPELFSGPKLVGVNYV